MLYCLCYTNDNDTKYTHYVCHDTVLGSNALTVLGCAALGNGFMYRWLSEVVRVHVCALLYPLLYLHA